MNIQDHIEQVTKRAENDVREKYKKGQEEHGGQLWKKGLLTLLAPQMRAEAIDQVVYTDVILEQLKEIKQLCETYLNDPCPPDDYYAPDPERVIENIITILNGTIQTD